MPSIILFDGMPSFWKYFTAKSYVGHQTIDQRDNGTDTYDVHGIVFLVVFTVQGWMMSAILIPWTVEIVGHQIEPGQRRSYDDGTWSSLGTYQSITLNPREKVQILSVGEMRKLTERVYRFRRLYRCSLSPLPQPPSEANARSHWFLLLFRRWQTTPNRARSLVVDSMKTQVHVLHTSS